MPPRINNYEIEEELFKSGPSTFFRARNSILGSPVLVQRLEIDPARADDVRATFFREMRHAAAIAHPRIQRPTDVLDLDGYLWSVMEYRTGIPSDRRAKEAQFVSMADAAKLGSEVADALAHMHAKGFVHGKVAPPWILVDEHGIQLVNLVKSADLAGGVWPLRPAVLGLSPFSSPEELRGEKPTRESDIHSLAATVVWWLTGEYPHGGSTPEEAMALAGTCAPAVDLHQLRPDVPKPVADALLAALECDPKKRHGSAASLATVLLETHRRLAAEVPSGFETGVHLLPTGETTTLEILGRHGSGAFGVVFRARTRGSDTLFAVKALKPEHRSDMDARERFLREARAMREIDHPNVVRIRGVGEEGGTPYAVMDFIPGPDLGTILLKEGVLSPRRATRLAAGIARGLEAIHREGIVHRDLKPHNILVAKGDRPVIADFGVARTVAAARMTMTGHFVGTPAYMAPELFEDVPPSFAVDLYALGAILFELLSGSPPYVADDAIATIRAIRERPVPALPADLPAHLHEIVGRLLQKDPAQRYANARALASDLELLAARLDSEHVPQLEAEGVPESG